MAWIKTVKLKDADEKLQCLLDKQRSMYPIEYATPAPGASATDESIVESHTLIPDALFHAFSTFGALMSADLPLERRQHEMIATIVSVVNRCHY
jgi:alkylhydroperoxidase family enzyme